MLTMTLQSLPYNSRTTKPPPRFLYNAFSSRIPHTVTTSMHSEPTPTHLSHGPHISRSLALSSEWMLTTAMKFLGVSALTIQFLKLHFQKSPASGDQFLAGNLLG